MRRWHEVLGTLVGAIVVAVMVSQLLLAPIMLQNDLGSPIDSDHSLAGPQDSIFIENYVKSLETGGLIYNPSTEMTINISESINATIIKGNASGEPIKVAPSMEVNLKGSAFGIVPTTESRQFIAGDCPTIWKWDVTPRKIGNQTLDLLAYVIIKMQDGHEEKRALVKSKTIHIQVNPLEKTGMVDFIPSLFDGPWAKVIAALAGVIGFLALFFKDDILAWIRSKRESPKIKS
jgi:hypothetical protein